MGRIFLIVFIIAMVYLILRIAVSAWRKASIKEKFQRAEEVTSDFEQVQKYENKFGDLNSKNKTVNKFKKETL